MPARTKRPAAVPPAAPAAAAAVAATAAAAIAVAAFLAAPTPADAQTLNDLLRRTVEEQLRNVTRPSANPAPVPVPPQPQSPVSQPPAPPPVPQASPPQVPGSPAPAASSDNGAVIVASPSPPAGIAALDTRVADAPRTVDLRAGTPAPLADRFLPANGRIVVANPYVPDDRRFIDGVAAMACHPQGGLVMFAGTRRYEPSAQRGAGREYVDNGFGLWRVEADGRVRPMLVVPEARFWTRDTYRSCGVAGAQARLGSGGGRIELAVDRDGQVYVADSGAGAIVRLRTDGVVDHVAGGGPAFCTTHPASRRPQRGHRDGPGADALFSGDLSIAVDAAGTLFVAGNDFANQQSPGNCSLRRIDASGMVTTVQGTGTCPTVEVSRANGPRSVGFEDLVVDDQGPLTMGVDRAPREPGGPDVVFTKVHRVDGPRATLLLRAGHGARFDPTGRLIAIGLGPGGVPLAWNAGYYGDAGLVALEDRPQFRYVWRSASRQNGQNYVDGPRGQAVIDEAEEFCTATDGKVYVRTKKAIRRIDPASGAVDTWVQ